MSRADFREQCVNRDNGQCLIPWCQNDVIADPNGPGEIHHIIERKLWSDGGYLPDNGVCVCNEHHQMAEQNEIPPQAFWQWAGITNPVVPTPGGTPMRCHIDDPGEMMAINKWGESFDSPPHGDIREYHKYPSTRHLLPLYWRSERGTAQERTGRDDTGLTSVESFLDIPLVVSIKMDGSNAMLVADTDEPVRARNGRDAEHESFDQLKQEYWDRTVYENLPDHLQVFGENMYAKHSIHYGCDGCCDERNQGPPVDDVFLVFGVYDTRYDLWLSWPETEQIAEQIGFSTVPTIWDSNNAKQIADESEFRQTLTALAEDTVLSGHEGIIVRSMHPFHYGQFTQKLGKYVRPNHVQTDEHWSHGDAPDNQIQL